MAKSVDFRKRVLEYCVNEGHTIRETAAVFNVGKTTIQEWKKLVAETGSLEKRPLERTFKKVDPEKLKTYVSEHNDATLSEIAEHFGCCIAAAAKALRKQKITLKKKIAKYIERDEKERSEFTEKIAKIISEEPDVHIYYVDETGIDKFLYREKGRALRGVKIYAETKGKKFKRKSIVAAKCGHCIAAPLMYDGTMSGAMFEYWFANCLVKDVEKGSIFVMDNASIHSKENLLQLAEDAKMRVIFQPAYSPDLNKIEKFWAWLKKSLRNIIVNFDTLEDAICDAFRLYKSQFCPDSQV
jgi:transposase